MNRVRVYGDGHEHKWVEVLSPHEGRVIDACALCAVRFSTHVRGFGSNVQPRKQRPAAKAH